MTGRYGSMAGLDHHLTPDDEDERTDEERAADEEADQDRAEAEAESREDSYSDYDGPYN